MKKTKSKKKNPHTRRNLYLPDDIYHELKTRADKDDRSVSTYVERLLRGVLAI